MSSADVGRTFYLRVEGVNLAHFVYDTEDLSTIRGGSLLLLHATRRETLKAALPADAKIVTSGASQAMFAFQAASRTEATAVRDRVEAFLRDTEPFCHATFVVDVGTEQVVADAPPQFAQVRESLLACNRWRQMQSLSLPVPAWSEQPFGAGNQDRYCDVDFVRPRAGVVNKRNEKKQQVSASVAARAVFGWKEKQAFYEREMRSLEEDLQGRLKDCLAEDQTTSVQGKVGKLLAAWKQTASLDRRGAGSEAHVAWDFHQIATREDAYRVREQAAGDEAEKKDPLGRLDDKIAVVYVDGNSFGAIQRASLMPAEEKAGSRPIEGQAAWDTHVQGLRRCVLLELLDQIEADPDWRFRWEGQELGRLETLLWGGDELTWVVPAWKGWSTLRLFLERAQQWPMWEVSPGRPVRLTHAAGLVFCHADAPIHRIARLARELADVAKQQNRPCGEKWERFEDVAAYHVLESFDQLGQSFHAARARHLPADCTTQDLVLRARELESLSVDLAWMIKHFPRGSVYRILSCLRKGDWQEAERWLRRAVKDVRGVSDATPETHPRLASFWEQFGDRGEALRGKRVRWLHLAELWDYLPNAAQPQPT